MITLRQVDLCFFLPAILFLLLSSCTGYHYVSPVPSAPQFEKAGELQGQLFASFTQVGFQGSFAVTSYLGASYAGYRSGPNNKTDSYTLHSYYRPGKKSNLFLSAFVGYSIGKYSDVHSSNNALLSPGTKTEWRNHSNYEMWNGGFGFYFRPKEGRWQVGFQLDYKEFRFFQMQTEYFETYRTQTIYKKTLLAWPQDHVVMSPSLIFTLASESGYFFFRQITSFDLGGGSLRVYQSQGGPINTLVGTMEPKKPSIYLYCSAGIRLSVYQELKKILPVR